MSEDEARVKAAERTLRSMGLGAEPKKKRRRRETPERDDKANPYDLGDAKHYVTLEYGTPGAFSAYRVTERFAYVCTALRAGETLRALKEAHPGKWKLIKQHRRYPCSAHPHSHHLVTYERESDDGSEGSS